MPQIPSDLLASIAAALTDAADWLDHYGHPQRGPASECRELAARLEAAEQAEQTESEDKPE